MRRKSSFLRDESRKSFSFLQVLSSLLSELTDCRQESLNRQTTQQPKFSRSSSYALTYSFCSLLLSLSLPVLLSSSLVVVRFVVLRAGILFSFERETPSPSSRCCSYSQAPAAAVVVRERQKGG